MADAQWGRVGGYEGWFPQPQLGTRRLRPRPGPCTCPHTPYNPAQAPGIDPDCTEHGRKHT